MLNFIILIYTFRRLCIKIQSNIKTTSCVSPFLLTSITDLFLLRLLKQFQLHKLSYCIWSITFTQASAVTSTWFHIFNHWSRCYYTTKPYHQFQTITSYFHHLSFNLKGFRLSKSDTITLPPYSGFKEWGISRHFKFTDSLLW